MVVLVTCEHDLRAQEKLPEVSHSLSVRILWSVNTVVQKALLPETEIRRVKWGQQSRRVNVF